MEAMLQRHCARHIYVIPEGLRELMSDISREVLRSQPKDIYTFIADYLDALMITRENARVAARLVQSLTELATTTTMFLEETGIPRDEVDFIVCAIQKAFRKSIDSDHGEEEMTEEQELEKVVDDVLEEIQVSPEQANAAATIIQQAYKKFKERKKHEKELLAGMTDWRVAARTAIHFYRKTGVSNGEANRAATLIKAAYKGYYTRKMIKVIASAQPDVTEEEEEEAVEEEEEMREEGGKYSEEQIPGAIGIDSEDDYSKIAKSVKIDYNTVKPHVDFDTTRGSKDKPADSSQLLSTSSSIARYSLKYIFDKAVDKVSIQQSTLAEETSLEHTEEMTVEDFSTKSSPHEIQREGSDVERIIEPKSSQ